HDVPRRYGWRPACGRTNWRAQQEWPTSRGTDIYFGPVATPRTEAPNQIPLPASSQREGGNHYRQRKEPNVSCCAGDARRSLQRDGWLVDSFKIDREEIGKMAKDTKASHLEDGTGRARPLLHQHAREIQPFGKIVKLPIALDEKVCAASAENLNQILADTIALRDLYKKHHWQVAGHTFYQLH